MKRFWKAAEAVAADGEWGVELDKRPLRTPGRNLLVVPNERRAQAIASEWASAEEAVDPRAMPLTGLANAAIDRVAPDPAAFAADIGKYAEADLACYRAEGPRTLAERQAASWDALLAWARRRYDVDFVTTTGIVTARKANGFFLQTFGDDDANPATSQALFVFTSAAPAEREAVISSAASLFI